MRDLWIAFHYPEGVRALRAHTLGDARFERTVVRVDASLDDSYALDVFRVRGGKLRGATRMGE